MDIQLDHEWKLRPLKGDTGKAYVGLPTQGTKEKVFIKRNTTPMLAALSKEGITPKLIWTKRTSTGDTLTAQEWLEGRLLGAEEIGQRNDVMDVLYQLHHSQSLKQMLIRIGGQVVTPKMMLEQYHQALPEALLGNEFLNLVLQYLESHIPTFSEANQVVVHGDVNCRNWLVCQNYLYLVDWDSIMFADAAVDLGNILGHYLPISTWEHWLISYGLQPDSEKLERIYWYALLSMMQEIKKYHLRGEDKALKEEILQLKRVYSG
ncbi:MAG: phosphotransferase [Enterococcus sp.]